MKRIICSTFLYFFLIPSAQAGLFSFLKCTEGGEQTLCRFCIASNARGSNRVCSKPYNKNLENSIKIGEEEYQRPIGFRSITEDLANDMANKLIEIKNFPKDNFDVKAFYEKYADYSCEEGNQEIRDINLQLKSLSQKDLKKKEKSWNQQQIDFLNWKKKKVLESMKKKKCSKT